MEDSEEHHQLKVQLASLQSELHENELLSRTLQTQLNETRGALRGLERTLEKREDELTVLRAENTKLQRDNEGLRDEVATLCEQALSATAGGNFNFGASLRMAQPSVTAEVHAQTDVTIDDLEAHAMETSSRISELEAQLQRVQHRLRHGDSPSRCDEYDDEDSVEGREARGLHGTPNSASPQDGDRNAVVAMPKLSLNLAQQQSRAAYGEEENTSFCLSTRVPNYDGVTPRALGGFMSSRGVPEMRGSMALEASYRPQETPRVTRVVPPSHHLANQRANLGPAVVSAEMLMTPRVAFHGAINGPVAATAAAAAQRPEQQQGGEGSTPPPSSRRATFAPGAIAAAKKGTADAATDPTSPMPLGEDFAATRHMFNVEESPELEDCAVCDLMEQVQAMYSGKMVDRHAYYAVGWIPEMCNRWQAEHNYTWTIEERAMMARILDRRPCVSHFNASRMEGPLYLWRSRMFWKSPWKPSFAILHGVFLYIFASKEPAEQVIAVTLVRGATIQSCQADGKDYCLKITSLCCRNCIGGTESDCTEVMTLAFDTQRAASQWSTALLAVQKTCPHKCSSKFENEINALREITECLLQHREAKCA